MFIAPASLEALEALCLGFAFSGLLTSGYEFATGRTVDIGLLRKGGLAALASVPLLVFAAPVLILRALILIRKADRVSILSVMTASAIATVWGLLCGRLVLDAALLVTGA